MDKIKTQAPEWDTDRNPNSTDFMNFTKHFENMVDTMQGGRQLIDFLLHTENRERVTSRLMPSSLQGDMWQDDDDDEEHVDPAQHAKDKDEEGTTKSLLCAMPKTKITSYRDLPKESKILDKMLFPILQRCVQGSKNALLNKGQCKFTHGMHLLYEHFMISKSKRKTEAFEQLAQLKFQGNVQDYQVSAIKAITEIYESKCTIEDLVMAQVMQSFEGVNKQIQHEIANDMDQGTDKINIFDAVTKYCSHLASVQSTQAQVHNVNKMAKCSRCHKSGHHRSECFARRDADGNELQDKPPCMEPDWYKDLMGRKKKATTSRQQALLVSNEQLKMIAEHVNAINNVNKYSSSSQQHKSVLDSGASVHIGPDVVVTEASERIDVHGFNSSHERTQGTGHIPCTFRDLDTNELFALDIVDCHRMDSVAKQLFSLGKLLREGFEFVARDHGNFIRLRTPDGKHTISVELGEDDILYLAHGLQATNNDAAHYVKKKFAQGHYEMLHYIFNHASLPKILKTLEHTKGLRMVGDAKDAFCTACACAKNKRKGMRGVRACLCEYDEEDDFIEDDGLQHDDKFGSDVEQEEYVAPVEIAVVRLDEID